MSNHARQVKRAYTYWVAECPFCQARKVDYLPGRELPLILACEGCGRSSAAGAWAVLWEEYFWQDAQATWQSRLVTAVRDRKVDIDTLLGSDVRPPFVREDIDG